MSSKIIIAIDGTSSARDFGPRLVYSLLPRKNKNADWSYSWIPVLGPILGAILAGLLYNFIM